MKTTLLVALSMVICSTSLIGQDTEWKVEKGDHGAVVRSIVRTEVAANGDERIVASYVVEQSAVGSLDHFERFMRNADNYKVFIKDIEKSFQTKRISNDEWVTYLYWDMPWPLSNMDCVQRMRFIRNGPSGFTIDARSDPDLYPRQDVDRMGLYNAKYDLVQTGDQVNVIIAVTFTLANGVQKWMIRSWFPDGPADIADRLIKEALN